MSTTAPARTTRTRTSAAKSAKAATATTAKTAKPHKAGKATRLTKPDTTVKATDLEQVHPGGVPRILNVVPSTGTETDWSADDALEAGLLTAVRRPDAVDLRQDWWTVGDQGSTGSCVGWATADGVGRYLMVTGGRLASDQRLSPRFIWMSSKETDEFDSRPTSFVEGSGTSLKSAMDVARKFGFALETDLPFAIATTMYLGQENAFYAAAAQRRVSYVNLDRDLEKWKDWLHQNGPILAGLSVDENWMRLGARGKLDAYAGSHIYGGHAVCIVGYRRDGTFIVRNSWGTGWGAHGFAYVTPAYLEAAFYPESYGAKLS
ncbi:MAG TPA: hypothetical protein DHV14_09345 [Micrococcales bacterium]|uniref:C1 family peptidase n=1 Tax=Miniimonas arenae TaxID=676201 RepID=UPI000ED29C0E|nr:C1 family peptidase [Miniimonas arenae]HCX85317.1 hypothetical protein [Micrococcales bacterium]